MIIELNYQKGHIGKNGRYLSLSLVKCENCNKQRTIDRSNIIKGIGIKHCRSCHATLKGKAIGDKNKKYGNNGELLEKKCIECNQYKSPSEFYLSFFNGVERISSECKICVKKRTKKYALENVESQNESKRRWAIENPDKRKLSSVIYNRKLLSTPKGKLDGRISSGMGRDLRNRNSSKGNKPWEVLVGYTLDDLYKHIESLFTDGMCWERISEIEIDHIIPKRFFKYNNPNDLEFKKCWSLSNLRPMWAKDNRSKNDYLPNGQRARHVC